ALYSRSESAGCKCDTIYRSRLQSRVTELLFYEPRRRSAVTCRAVNSRAEVRSLDSVAGLHARRLAWAIGLSRLWVSHIRSHRRRCQTLCLHDRRVSRSSPQPELTLASLLR